MGNPYASGAIETCCVIAWAAMSAEMLKMTDNSVVADELELTFLNAIMAYRYMKHMEVNNNESN